MRCETGRRRIRPAITRTIPSKPSGAAATDGTVAMLIPFANSDGVGVVGEFATESNAKVIPATVATRHKAANNNAAMPDQTSQGMPRVFCAAFNAVPGW